MSGCLSPCCQARGTLFSVNRENPAVIWDLTETIVPAPMHGGRRHHHAATATKYSIVIRFRDGIAALPASAGMPTTMILPPASAASAPPAPSYAPSAPAVGTPVASATAPLLVSQPQAPNYGAHAEDLKTEKAEPTLL